MFVILSFFFFEKRSGHVEDHAFELDRNKPFMRFRTSKYHGNKNAWTNVVWYYGMLAPNDISQLSANTNMNEQIQASFRFTTKCCRVRFRSSGIWFAKWAETKRRSFSNGVNFGWVVNGSGGNIGLDSLGKEHKAWDLLWNPGQTNEQPVK